MDTLFSTVTGLAPGSDNHHPVSVDPSAQKRQQGGTVTGVLPYQALRALGREKRICGSPEEMTEDQFQPASIDLRLGTKAHRVRASFLPNPGETIKERLIQDAMHEINLAEGAVLEPGCVYVVPLMESVKLPAQTAGFASPKSSTGRLDVFTRLIVDREEHFDRVTAGYHGRLYLEVAPRSFSIKVRSGDRLAQLRLQRGKPMIGASQLTSLQAEERLVDAATPVMRDGVIAVRVDLSGSDSRTPIGYRARKNADTIDLSQINHYDPRDFWEPLPAKERRLILDPDSFYILATRENVRVPEWCSAEMIPYDSNTGAFRVHYAGFFDPGFGCQAASGSKAVLEVRAYEVPFLLEDGQIVGWLRYDPLSDRPDRVYGQDIGSSYEGQGLKLAKQFQPWVF